VSFYFEIPSFRYMIMRLRIRTLGNDPAVHSLFPIQSKPAASSALFLCVLINPVGALA